MKPELTVEELKERLDRGEPVLVLDVRSAGEFARWRIEGARGPAILNVPYTRILGAAEEDDLAKAAADYAAEHLHDRLPRDRPVVAVCAKGGASAFVAEGLRSLGYEASNLRGGMAAWGDHYEIRVVLSEGDLVVHQVARPARGCLSYVVASRGEAVVLDPLRHDDRYARFVEQRGLRLVRVLDTHAHADHISGARALARRLGVPYGFHPYDGIHPMDGLPATFDYEPLWDGWRVELGASVLEARHVPGHTLGNLAFLLDRRILFSGDSIFLRSIARPDLGGKAEAWTALHYRSLRRLMELPAETLVLPGHFSGPDEAGAGGVFAAPLGEVRTSNEGLKMAAGSQEAFTSYILSSLPSFPPEYLDIKRVNAGLLEATEDLAAELELGKNLCALAG